MKKIFIAILCLMLLAGCGANDNNTNTETDEVYTQDEQKSPSTEEKSQAEEEETEDTEEEDNINYGSLNTSYLVDIGCTPEQISALRGELKTATWADGPIYSFGDDGVWYGFENYDFSDGEIPYIPNGKCTQMSMSMKMLIKDADVYSIETLRALSKGEISEEYDEFAESNVYVAHCNGFVLKAYGDNEKSIGAETIITATKEQ